MGGGLQSQIRVSKEDAWSEGDSKTSKFAQWFHREGTYLLAMVLTFHPHFFLF